jgi:hypothetical protein
MISILELLKLATAYVGSDAQGAYHPLPFGGVQCKWSMGILEGELMVVIQGRVDYF